MYYYEHKIISWCALLRVHGPPGLTLHWNFGGRKLIVSSCAINYVSVCILVFKLPYNGVIVSLRQIFFCFLSPARMVILEPHY